MSLESVCVIETIFKVRVWVGGRVRVGVGVGVGDGVLVKAWVSVRVDVPVFFYVFLVYFGYSQFIWFIPFLSLQFLSASSIFI